MRIRHGMQRRIIIQGKLYVLDCQGQRALLRWREMEFGLLDIINVTQL